MYPRAEHTPVGIVTARATNPTTRRGTPWQERSPTRPMAHRHGGDGRT